MPTRTADERLASSFGHYRTLLDDGRVNAAWTAAGNQLSIPVLAIGGAQSVGDRPATSLHPVAPHAEAADIAGSGHFLAEEQPAKLTEHPLASLGQSKPSQS